MPLLLLALLVPAHAGKKVTLRPVPLAVGETLEITERVAMEFQLELEADGGQRLTTTLNALRTRVLHLEVTAPGGATLQLTYPTATETLSIMGQTLENPSPTQGRTYHLDLGASPPAVTRPDGRLPADDELSLVDEDLGNWVIPVLAIDEPVTLRAGDTWEPGVPGRRVSDSTLVFTGTRREAGQKLAAFSATGTTDATNGDMAMEADISGEWLVDVRTGFPARMLLSGPVSLEGASFVEALPVVVGGVGAMSAEATFTRTGP